VAAPKPSESQHKRTATHGPRTPLAALIDPRQPTFFELGHLRRPRNFRRVGRRSPSAEPSPASTAFLPAGSSGPSPTTPVQAALFPMTQNKVIRAQNSAIEKRIPTLYGSTPPAYLPLQEDGLFPRQPTTSARFRTTGYERPMAFRKSPPAGLVRWPGGRLSPGDVRPHPCMTEGSGLFLACPRWCKPPSARDLRRRYRRRPMPSSHYGTV